MTVFAVMIAGLFPFIHLGRVWLFYWIIPYPNQRTLWPDFQSPLMFDFLAISTYFTVSVLFWYTGLVPDLAAVRDGAKGIRRKIYGVLSLGWTGTDRQWHLAPGRHRQFRLGMRAPRYARRLYARIEFCNMDQRVPR